MSAGFWDTECPERGPGLYHKHWSQCRQGEAHPGTQMYHMEDQCCHCGMRERVWQKSPTATAVELVDVDARLKSLGLIPPDAASDPDGVPREPKFITDKGPQGKFDGKGRGDLTMRQMRRLVSWKGWINFLGGDDAP